MRVLNLADFSPPYMGSFGRSQFVLAQKLAERGDTYLLCLPEHRDWHRKFAEIGVSVSILPIQRYPVDMNLVSGLKEIVQNDEIDIIHTHFGIEHLLASSLVKCFHAHELHLIHHWRGGPKRSTAVKRVIGSLVYRFICSRLLSMQIANSMAIYRQIDSLHYSKGNLMCIHNGIDIDTSDGEEPIRKKYGIPENAVLFAHVRNFRMAVDFDLVFDTAVMLLDKLVDAYMIFVGDGPMKEKYQAKCSSISHSNRIIFTGQVSNTAAFYKAADFTFSTWEPWCGETVNNAVYESLAVGTPVLGVDAGALPDMFNEKEGVIVAEPMASEMAQKALWMLTNRDSIIQSAVRNIPVVRKEYSVETWADRIIEVYRGVIDNS